MESLVNKKTLENFYRGKKIFVTGHTGFKGSWLITWLNLLGADVKGYALAPENEESIFNTLSTKISFENIIADIRDKEKLQKEIIQFQPDYIFHLAAQALVRRSYKYPAQTFEVNAIGTANLLESVMQLKKKCTILIITTDKVYENKESGQLYKENDNLGGYDPYSASKACTEIVAHSFQQSFFNKKILDVHNKSIATVRAGNVIGGGDWGADRIMPDIIQHLQSQKEIPVRNPTAVRPWQHVLEPLGGYLLLGGLLNEKPLQYSSAYNFGPENNDHLPVKTVVEIAIDCWGKGEWKDVSDMAAPHEAVILKLDISLAKNELIWKPKLKSKEAIKWTIDWYRQEKEMLFDYTIEQIETYQSL
jgi:CDP-glucose 4,6-dehydratase